MTNNKIKKLLTIEEVLGIIPMSKAGIYKACADGKIKTIKIGKRIFVNADYLNQLIGS